MTLCRSDAVSHPKWRLAATIECNLGRLCRGYVQRSQDLAELTLEDEEILEINNIGGVQIE